MDSPERNTTAEREFLAGIGGAIHGEMNSIYGEVIARDDLWEFALGLAFDEKPQVAFRSSWALEWAYFNDREAFRPHIPHFIDNFVRAQNSSVHRHYTKMLHDMLTRGLVVPDGATADALAEKAFDLLIAPETRTAVTVWAMEILYELAPRIGWVAEELPLTIRRILESDPSPGTANRARKVLKRMKEK